MSDNTAENLPPEETEAPVVADIQPEVPSLEEENKKLRDQLLRAIAETDNVRKRADRDREEISKYAVSKFAGDMVSVLENLKRASGSIPLEAREQNPQLKVLGEGVDLTLQELLATFDRYGIKRIDPMGEKFDHNLHQAVAQAPHPDAPAGTVIQVVQAGYVIADRLLRPAMVVVSKAADEAKKVDTTA